MAAMRPVALIFFAFCVSQIQCAETKIPLGPDNCIDGFAAAPPSPPTPATNMLDEQDIAGDPANGKPGNASTVFFPGWTSWYYPDSFYLIDLETTYTITSVWLFQDWGSISLNFSLGYDVATWSYTWSYTVSKQGWANFTVPNVQNVRWLRVQFLQSPGSALLELVLYGTQTGASPTPPKPSTYQQPLLKNFIGANCFWNDPIDKLAAVGVAREYHDWGWDEGNGEAGYVGYPNSQNKFEPAYPADDWMFDDFYAAALNAGVSVHQCMQKCAEYIKNNDGSRTDEKPLTDAQMAIPGATLDPTQYAAHADHAYQLAARYGSVAVPVSNLKLAPDQPAKSGLNLLKWLEFWNEQDKWWENRACFFSPWEYAAMLSADYDAHLGTMDKTIGVHNADPQMKVVMGGIADADYSLNYVRSMKAWVDAYRKGSFPAEAINFHHYCNNGQNGNQATSGISPEDDQFGAKTAKFAQWRDANLPTVELWISEFGYDTNQGSPQKAPTIGPNSGEVVQAQWLLRSYLALVQANVSRAHMYMLQDTDGGYGIYASSGLVTASQYEPAFSPKVSWYYVYTFKNRLGDYAFLSNRQDQGLQISVFQKLDKSNTAYVVWSPTSNNSIVNNYKLALNSGGNLGSTATLVQFADKQTNGTESQIPISSGTVTVTVSETPIIVIV